MLFYNPLKVACSCQRHFPANRASVGIEAVTARLCNVGVDVVAEIPKHTREIMNIISKSRTCLEVNRMI